MQINYQDIKYKEYPALQIQCSQTLDKHKCQGVLGYNLSFENESCKNIPYSTIIKYEGYHGLFNNQNLPLNWCKECRLTSIKNIVDKCENDEYLSDDDSDDEIPSKN